MPVGLAPVGALGLYNPGDALASARAATAAGIPVVCSQFAESPWAWVAATAPGRHFLQLYALGDRAWLNDILAGVEGLGFAGLCVTLDSPVIGRRDRSLADGYICDVNFDALPGADPPHRSRFTWSELQWLCGQTSYPVMARGGMSSEDAEPRLPPE